MHVLCEFFSIFRLIALLLWSLFIAVVFSYLRWTLTVEALSVCLNPLLVFKLLKLFLVSFGSCISFASTPLDSSQDLLLHFYPLGLCLFHLIACDISHLLLLHQLYSFPASPQKHRSYFMGGIFDLSPLFALQLYGVECFTCDTVILFLLGSVSKRNRTVGKGKSWIEKTLNSSRSKEFDKT